MIDRSQFLEELKRNPDLMHRIAVITAGEVSASAPISKQILQAETIFNRAMARGQTLEQVMQEHRFKGDAGYYPPETFTNGEKSLARNGGEARFKELVLKPVINGSDVGTQTLGFAPTGNASEGTNRFASSRAARGVYSQYKWHPDGKEMYVQEAGSGDRNERIMAKRTGAQPTQLADQLPGGAQPAGYEGVNYATPRQTPEEAANTAQLKRHYGAGYQPPGVVDVANPAAPNLAQIPLPPQRPGGAGPGSGAGAAQATQATPSLADGLANLTIDEAQRGGGTAPTPEPLVAQAPPVATPPATPQTTTTVSARSTTPPRPVASLGDRIIQAMGPRGAGRSTYIDPGTGHQILNPGGSGEEGMGITRDLGRVTAPPGAAPSRSTARPASPRAVESSPGLRDMAQEPYTRATVPDILAPENNTRRTVPDIQTDMRTPAPAPSVPFDENDMQRRNAFDRPGLKPFDTTMFDVKPTGQQRPLGDFTPARPVQADFVTELSRALRLPTRQNATVPPPSNTPFPLAPDAARLLAPPTSGPAPTLPRSLEDRSVAPAFGGRPSPLPFTPRTTGEQLLGLSPFTPGAGGSATQPPVTVQQRPTQPEPDVPAQAAPAVSPVAGGPNLSPFEQWPPPWWNFAGGDFGGDFGAGFGGGYDFGAFG